MTSIFGVKFLSSLNTGVVVVGLYIAVDSSTDVVVSVSVILNELVGIAFMLVLICVNEGLEELILKVISVGITVARLNNFSLVVVEVGVLVTDNSLMVLDENLIELYMLQLYSYMEANDISTT